MVTVYHIGLSSLCLYLLKSETKLQFVYGLSLKLSNIDLTKNSSSYSRAVIATYEMDMGKVRGAIFQLLVRTIVRDLPLKA